MTITVRRTVELTREIIYDPNGTDMAAEVDATRLECNHHYSIIDEMVTIDDTAEVAASIIDSVARKSVGMVG